MQISITGKITKVDIGPGFWGVITSAGKKYRITNMPSQLKEEGRQITVSAKAVDEMSIFQWGEAVEITESVKIKRD